jgi:hypothetical protein
MTEQGSTGRPNGLSTTNYQIAPFSPDRLATDTVEYHI